jgi:uncharacterized protein
LKELNTKKTLVIGASTNEERYSNMAIHRLHQKQHEVVAIGTKPGNVDGVYIETELKLYNDIHTVTLYINPTVQKDYYQYILDLHPKRVIFNPGTENETFKQLITEANIEAIEACTLVMLGNHLY